MSNDYIPAKEGDFLEWSENLIAVCSAHADEWAIDTEKLDSLQTLHGQYKALYETCQTPAHNTLDVQRKNGVKDDLKERERKLVAQLQVNDAVTDPDRVALRIPRHDHKPSPTPPPSAQLEVDITFPGIHLVEVSLRAVGSMRRGFPAGVRGARIYYGLMDSPPASGDDLPHSVFTRKSKHLFDFAESERGKKVFFCARSENSKGDVGPWGTIFFAIIP